MAWSLEVGLRNGLGRREPDAGRGLHRIDQRGADVHREIELTDRAANDELILGHDDSLADADDLDAVRLTQRTGNVRLLFDFEGAPEDESIIHT